MEQGKNKNKSDGGVNSNIKELKIETIVDDPKLCEGAMDIKSDDVQDDVRGDDGQAGGEEEGKNNVCIIQYIYIKQKQNKIQ